MFCSLDHEGVVTILTVANEIIYSGFSFDVDYEKMGFTKRQKSNEHQIGNGFCGR